MPTTPEQASPWLQGRTFASWREEFDRRGYLIFERVLAAGSCRRNSRRAGAASGA